MPREACRALITDEEGTRLLLSKRAEGDFEGGKWCAFGGKRDLGESPEEAVARETFEEAGLVLHGIELFHEHTSNGWLTSFFKGKVIGVLDLDPTESSEARYFSKEELPELEVAFDHLQVYTDFLNSIRQ
jgi:8-oxo-dGTP pyrophosphatase MutT (NUDIX family)